MEKKEVLKNLITDLGIHTLAHHLNIDYNQLIQREYHGNDKVTEEGLGILLNNKDLKTQMLDWVFPLEANGIMLPQDYFLTNPAKAYESLLLITETEHEINKIFSKSAELLSNEREDYLPYRKKFIKFLNVVIMQSESKTEVEKMFVDFNQIKKSDKSDLFPIVTAFMAKGISADRIYQSIKDLNNSYLETRIYDYVIENNLSHTFELKSLDMYETTEKIIFEKSIKFNTNYFMSFGLDEEKVLVALEKFSDLICNVDNVIYLIKRKEKVFNLILRSENEETINDLYKQITQHSSLIVEFTQGYDNSKEYESKFMTYWYLNKQLSPKNKTTKAKI